jgi:hypothetical protein
MKVCQRMDIDVEGDDECKIINELWKDAQQLTHVTIHGREYEWLPFFLYHIQSMVQQTK